MNVETGLLIACIVIAILGVLWAVVAWQRDHGWGRIVQGVAIAVGAIGLYLSGLMQLLWNGLQALWDWLNTVSLNGVIATGVGMVIAGIVLWLIGSFMRAKGYGRPSPEERRNRLEARKQRKQAVGHRATTDAVSTTNPSTTVDSDDEMDEIAAILKKRGIE